MMFLLIYYNAKMHYQQSILEIAAGLCEMVPPS